MLGKGAHVEHDKFRLTKHLGVDPLQDEVLFCFGIQGYQEGVIDIATAIFMDVNDRALWFELICSGSEIFQSLILIIELSIQKEDSLSRSSRTGSFNIEYRTRNVEQQKFLKAVREYFSLRYSAVPCSAVRIF